MSERASSGLAGVLAPSYTLLIVYASLYPFADWRDTGVPIFAFLGAAWPRYWTVFDLVTNAFAYLPLGFLWVAVGPGSWQRWLVAPVVLIAGSGLSLSMETIQNFLPSRVSSNVDLGCNALGTLLGVLAGLRWGSALRDGGSIDTLRDRFIVRGRSGDYGLLLIALWLLAQLNPEILLFGTGDLRRLLDLPASMPFNAERFSRLEATIAAANALAVALLAAILLQVPRRAPLVGLILLALAVKMLAAAILINPSEYAHWLTPGNSVGVAIGTALAMVAMLLPRVVQRAAAALALLLSTVLVNLAPANPYLADMLQTWQQGNFLNFNGLTRLASYLWPFLALPWLMLAERRTRSNAAPRASRR
jgi:VanZ family protein